MNKALTEDIKDRLKNLQQQKSLLQEELEYAKSSKRMEQIEQDIYEINDTIKKLRGE
tara:strand:+ start:962 stop:1132 length:171 start_codon:yes stop_codon:yes gene_type:complete